MKLLKFVNADAPQTFADAHLARHTLTFKSKKGHAPVAKAWSLRTDADAVNPLQGCYWLLDDNNKPVDIIQEVILAVPALGDGGSGDANGKGSERGATSSSRPRGVTDEDVKGLDLRSKLGRQLERSRSEYGTTYKTASKSAREMMNAEEVTEKRHEQLKREREAMAEAVEAGEGLPEKKTKRSKRKKDDTR